MEPGSNSEADSLTSSGERYTIAKGWFGGGVCGDPRKYQLLDMLPSV
jgi:hypothetical protein